MELKRPGGRESLITYLLQPLVGAPLRRPSAAQLLLGTSDSGAPIDSVRASYEAMSDDQIGELVAKKRQQEDDARKVRLAEEAKALAAKQVEEDRALFFNQPNAAADFRYW